jgi:phage terminase large subunit-like protein
VDWTTACLDWEDRIRAGQSLVPFAPLFPDEAAAALAILRQLKLVDVAGSPTMGEACRDWVFDFAAAIFGAYDPQTGRRLIQEFLLLVSKKNSKSTIAAGIMLTALMRNWRLSGEFIILAPTIEIAKNSFGPASDMVRHDPELAEFLKIQEHIRTITHRLTGATLKMVAADDQTVSGKKAIGVLVDELWLFGKQPNAEGMLNEATGGLASRPEGFVISLTTQSDDPPAGVFLQKLNYFRGVRDGRITDKRSLGVLYEFPPAMIAAGLHRDPKNFYITNPNLGRSVDREFLEVKFEKAVQTGEESVRGFLAKHLNVEIGLALRSDRWAGADHWEAAADDDLTLTSLIERSELIVVGIDGGGLDDLLGLCVLGRERETRDWLCWNRAWAHNSVLERRKSEAARLKDLEAAGELVLVADLPEDLDHLADIVERIFHSGLLGGIAVDPAGIGAIVEMIAARGISADPEAKAIIGIPQGWKLSGAIKTAERKLAEHTLWHAGQKLMNWCVGNARVEPKGNAVTITKQASGKGKIDPLVATLIAIALMSTNPAPLECHDGVLLSFV